MDALAYSQSARVPYLTYPADAASKFYNGYTASIAFFVVQLGITMLVWWMHQRDLRQIGPGSVSRCVDMNEGARSDSLRKK